MLLVQKVSAVSIDTSPETFNTILVDIQSTTTQTTQTTNVNERITNGEMKILTTSLKSIATVLPGPLVTDDSILDVSSYYKRSNC